MEKDYKDDSGLVKLESMKRDIENYPNNIPYCYIFGAGIFIISILIVDNIAFRIFLSIHILAFMVSTGFFMWQDHEYERQRILTDIDSTIKKYNK